MMPRVLLCVYFPHKLLTNSLSLRQQKKMSSTKSAHTTLHDPLNNLFLVSYDEAKHLESYVRFMSDDETLAATKTEKISREEWGEILLQNRARESGAEQFMIEVCRLAEDGKEERVLIGDVSSYDVPYEEEEEEEEEKKGKDANDGVAKEVSICIGEKEHRGRGYASAAMKMFITYLEEQRERKCKFIVAKIEATNLRSRNLFLCGLGFSSTRKQRERDESGDGEAHAPNYFGEIELGLKLGTQTYGTMVFSKDEDSGEILGEMRW